jgi:hypothetical protein
MSKEIKLPDPDTHCCDDDSSKDVWSYSPELVRQIIKADRAQRGEPVLWRYRDSEQVIRAMDGYTPVEGWTPLYTATQPAHTEAEVQEILDSSLREWRSVFEQTVRIILNVEKP